MRLSIIIPVYNSVSKGLELCLESVLNQTYSNFELILVNDGSTDGSYYICRYFEGKDSRVKLIDKPNGGVSSARNAGLDIVEGRYVTFIDSDDVMSKDYISGLAENYGYDLTVCGVKQIFPDGKIKTYSLPDGVYSIDDPVAFHRLIQSRLVFGPCNKLFRTDVIADNNIRFPEGIDYGEDRLFCYQYLSKIKNFKGVSSVCYEYLIQPGDSLSTKYRSNLFELEYSQWKALYSLYKFHDVITDQSEKDLFTELFWLVNDAIMRCKGNSSRLYSDIKQILDIEEIDGLRQHSSLYQANNIIKKLILNRNAVGMYLFIKLMDLCKK